MMCEHIRRHVLKFVAACRRPHVQYKTINCLKSIRLKWKSKRNNMILICCLCFAHPKNEIVTGRIYRKKIFRRRQTNECRRFVRHTNTSLPILCEWDDTICYWIVWSSRWSMSNDERSRNDRIIKKKQRNALDLVNVAERQTNFNSFFCLSSLFAFGRFGSVHSVFLVYVCVWWSLFAYVFSLYICARIICLLLDVVSYSSDFLFLFVLVLGLTDESIETKFWSLCCRLHLKTMGKNEMAYRENENQINRVHSFHSLPITWMHKKNWIDVTEK